MPRGRPRGRAFTNEGELREPGQASPFVDFELPQKTYFGKTKFRGADEARIENPDTEFHESEDVADQARLRGVRDGLEVLNLIRRGARSPALYKHFRSWENAAF